MEKRKKLPAAWRFGILLAVGFLSLSLPGFLDMTWGAGATTLAWIFAFQYVVCEFCAERRLRLLTGAFFCVSYILRFNGILGIFWLNTVLFLAAGLLLYLFLCLYARLLRKWDRPLLTLAFPLMWLVLYLAATALRLPSIVRMDMMFVDLGVLIKAEACIGSMGLSFVLLWMVSLLEYGISRRRVGPAGIGVGIYLVLLLIGVARLYPNHAAPDTVRVAYATGPYGGDYLTYQAPPLERSLSSMEASAREAAAQGAGILVFNEEAVEMSDTEEPAFLEACRAAAKENGLHLLVGLDVGDTDGSEGGRSLNKIVWIDDRGEVLDAYEKARLIPVIESGYVPGDGRIPSHRITVGGREIGVSFLICYDSNFPQYVRHIADDTDILFLPSWDWDSVTVLHSKLCRAIAAENRVSILKPTYDGISIAVDPDGRILHSSSTAETGFETVHVVDMPVGVGDAPVLPHPASPYTAGIISAELLSILVCLILLYGNLFENRERSIRNKYFTSLVATNILALCADALSWILDGCTRLDNVLYVSTALSLILTFVLIEEFVMFLIAYIRERRESTSRLPRILTFYICTAIVLTLAACFSGQLFTIENGLYTDGPLYVPYVAVNVLSMFFCMAITIVCRRSLSRHDRVAAYLYVTLPGIGGLLNIALPEISFVYPAITLSLTIIYVMIQSERAARLETTGRALTHRATHDELTGLRNRAAYQDTLAALAAADGTAGAIFADLNGLKYANDHYGHEAGDALIVRFAKLLGGLFREDEIYRISGDEFVVLMPSITREAFAVRVEKLQRAVVNGDSSLASFGAEFGLAKEASELVREAETKMYEQKEAWHLTHPEIVRS